MSELQLHSFEAGRRGKPDELDSAVANLIAAEFLEINRDARFDIRVSGGYSLDEDKPKVRVSGEASDFVLQTDGLESRLTEVITHHYNDIHHTDLSVGDIRTSYEFKPQASNLALNGHAGDSGNPIAVAYRHAVNYLPVERYIAVELRDYLDEIFKADCRSSNRAKKKVSPEDYEQFFFQHFKADGKVGVDVLYNGAIFAGVQNIVLAVEHDHRCHIDDLRATLGRAIQDIFDRCRVPSNPEVVINGLGPWHQGGWKIDEGSREAKSYRDGFASYGCCEDSFSGEDPSKPSGTGTFLARYIAVNIVAAGLADFARVALTYTIGREEVGLNVTTQNTAKIPQEELHAWVRNKFHLRIKDAIELFGLKDPNLYRKFAHCSDYFHDPSYPWNQAISSKETL